MAKKPGKYEDVLKRLTPLPLQTEPAFQVKVNEVKDAIKAEFEATPALLARLYQEHRVQMERTEAIVSAENVRKEALEQLIRDVFMQEGMRSVALAGGGTVRTQPEPYAKVVDHARFQAWCLREGLGPKLQLPWQTTNTLTKDLLLKGEAEPDGVQAFIRTGCVWMKR